MNLRFFVRMTAPVVVISLLLLAVAVGTAWYVHRWQKRVSHDLRVNVFGVRAAEELEILIRETRSRLDRFLITNDRKYLAQVPKLQPETEHWLEETDRWGDTPREKELVRRARQGHQRFWSEWEEIMRPPPAPAEQIRDRIDALIRKVLEPEVLDPVHKYLDFNEDELEEAITISQAFADRLVYALLLLGTCGSAAGLVAGFGFARGLSRSLIQLSVLIRDAAGRLDAGGEPLTFVRGDLGELETVMRLITDRVEAIVKRLQEKEHEVLMAEQMAALGQLAAGMAHELRNPLTSMKILVQGAMAGAEAADAWDGAGLSSRDLGVLEEEITRLEQLVQSFLDFARPPTPEKRVVDVRTLVENTLALVAGRAAAAAVRIEQALPASPAEAAVDSSQFRQVLLNLVLNALDAMPGGGVISVRLEKGPEWLTLETTDTGCGLPAELGERIFAPFTTTKETGLGLGLSICRRIAAAHGGDLTAANRPGGGAVFTLRLPAPR